MKGSAVIHGSVALVAFVAISAPVRADDVTCPPNLGTVTIDGNVEVVAKCELRGTVVEGNVQLYDGGSLLARDARIDGNVQTEDDDAFEVDIVSSRIGGNVQLDDLKGDESFVQSSAVDGSIQVVGNRSSLQIGGNQVGADVQAFNNDGGIDISDNIIEGNLQCKENSPPPTGGGNVVDGNREDQCANLQPAPEGTLRTPASSTNDATTGDGGGGSFDLLVLGLLGILSVGAAVARRE